MRSRALLLLAVALLFLAPANSLVAAGSPSSGLQIGLGYGPTSITKVGGGVPVFTAGDEIWARSFYNSTVVGVSLTSPGGTVVETVALEPGNAVALYQLTGKDPSGTWTMYVNSFTGTVAGSVKILVANSSSVLEPASVAASLVQGSLQLRYSLPPTSAYNIEACTMGSAATSSTTLTLPGSIGGSLNVTLTQEGATLAAPYASVPFVTWLELYAPRGYVNGTSLVSELVLAAQTTPVPIQNFTQLTAAKMDDQLNLRPGRYDLRTFVRGPSGLTTFESQYLLTNSSAWVSMAGCSQALYVTSTPFTLTSSLAGSNSTWPRELFLMYTEDSVDSYTASRIPVEPARIDVKTPSGSSLVGATLSLTGQGVQSWGAYQGGVYLIGSRFPIGATVGIDFQGTGSETFDVTVPGAFSYVTLEADSGNLRVQTLVRGVSQANVTFYISQSGASPASFTSGANGTQSVVLRPGSYNVTAVFSGQAVSSEVEVTSGGKAAVVLDVNPPQPPLLEYALAGVLVAGVALNFFAWRAYFERKSALAR